MLMNKPVYLGLSILDVSKTELWYDYVNPKCYIDTDRFFCHVKTDDIYKDIVWDFETRFDPSNFEIGRLLPKGKNKK